jgi:hypothetical protein
MLWRGRNVSGCKYVNTLQVPAGLEEIDNVSRPRHQEQGSERAVVAMCLRRQRSPVAGSGYLGDHAKGRDICLEYIPR